LLNDNIFTERYQMKISKVFFCFFVFFNFGVIQTLADEDDYGDIFEDIAIGLIIAGCDSDEACSSTMSVVVLISFVIISILSCLCPPEERFYEPPKPKRVARVGASYLVGRAVFG